MVTMGENVSIVVFTQANMNATDGSSVWAQTITLALAGLDDVEVTLLLSHATTTDRMLGPLLRHPKITVIDPVSSNLTASDPLPLDTAGRILARMTARGPQAIIVRGAHAAHKLASRRALRGKLWPYLTDIPQQVDDIDEKTHQMMSQIMAASPILLCQTEELLSFLESHIPAVAGKGWLLPPAVPDDVMPMILPAPTPDDLRMCYSGKFARRWNTYEMCELPERLAERGVNARVTMVGDKVNQDPTWPEFVVEMKEKLKSSPGVEWVGGVSRDRSIELMASAHIGLGWRSPEMDHSLELSTKLLEYCAAGTPPLLNRTAMHERIFGEDYPLFVDSSTSAVDVLESVAKRPEVYGRALHLISSLAADYTLEKTTERLASIVSSYLYRERPGRGARLTSWLSRRRHRS